MNKSRFRWFAQFSVASSTLLISSTLFGAVPMVSQGLNHTAYLKNDGTVWTSGGNASGQLGDGTTTGRTTPAIVPGLSNVISVCATGSSTSDYCVALKADGTVWTWGSNSNGQLGNGTTTRSLVPDDVPGLSGVRAISAGRFHVMALKADGTIWAWGSQDAGVLGNGFSGTGNQLSPTQITNWGDDNIQIQCGFYHTMVLKSNGTVWGSGSNIFYQLADSSIWGSDVPLQIPGITNAISISTYSHNTYVLNSDRRVITWGHNQYGDLGDGTTTNRTTPMALSILNVKSVASTGAGAVALTSDGKLYGWGQNVFGQLGLGHTTNQLSPVLCSSFGDDIVSVCNGLNAVFAVKADGSIYVSGYNTVGQLGIGTTTHQSTATLVSGISNLRGIEISAGRGHSMAIKPNGELWTWGDADSGRLGHGSSYPSEPLPVHVSSLSNVRQISAGKGYHSTALTSESATWGWGKNDYNQTGYWDPNHWSNLPLQITYDGMLDISAGFAETLALDHNGEVWGWGFNGLYALALPDYGYPNTYLPTPLGITDIKAISMGRQHALALKANGTVVVWGRNHRGQLGLGTTSASESVPQVIPGLDGVIAISTGDWQSMALKADGTVWAWGGNDSGQLGDGTTSDTPTPQQVPVGDAIAIACGVSHSMVLLADGTVFAWGNGWSGQLGEGSLYSYTPVQSLISNVRSLSTCGPVLAVTASGTLLAWGPGGHGQLGDGNSSNSFYPVAVSSF